MVTKARGLWKLLQALDDAAEKAMQWAWRHRKLLGAAVAVLLTAWALGTAEDPDPEAPPEEGRVVAASDGAAGPVDALTNRLWIDHAPKGHQDRFHMYFFLKNEKHPLGVHITFHSATWRVQEFFTWKLAKKQLHLRFYSPKVEASSKFQIEKLDHEHFDMAVRLAADPQHKGQPHRYMRLKQRGTEASWLPRPEQLRELLEGLSATIR